MILDPTPLLDLAIRIQQIPAPTFQESERARFVCEQMQALGLEDIRIDPIDNVYARLPGLTGRGRKPVVVSAHLDTVFPIETALDIRREDGRVYGPGIGDNSLAVAGLLWLADFFRSHTEPLPGDLWLVANVGEEGLGDLRGMHAVVDRLGDQPAAYIVLEGTALGQVYNRGLPVRRYRIRATTDGGHSWAHFGQPSAIHELAAFIMTLERLDIPKEPRTTYNAGVIRGGTSVNTIAASAEIELDLRSESPETLAGLAQTVEQLALESRSDGVRFELEVIGDRPGGSCSIDDPLVASSVQSLQQLGMSPQLKIGSTDANVPLSRGLPAVCIGLTTGGGAHTLAEYIDTAPLETGMKHVTDVIRAAFMHRN